MIPRRGGRFPKLGANGKMFGDVTRSFLLYGPSVTGSEVLRAGCGGMDPHMGQDNHGVGEEVGGWEPGSGPSSDLIFCVMLTSACLFLSLSFLKCSKEVER